MHPAIVAMHVMTMISFLFIINGNLVNLRNLLKNEEKE